MAQAYPAWRRGIHAPGPFGGSRAKRPVSTGPGCVDSSVLLVLNSTRSPTAVRSAFVCAYRTPVVVVPEAWSAQVTSPAHRMLWREGDLMGRPGTPETVQGDSDGR